MNGEVVVTDKPDAGRYEITVDGERVGLVNYRLSDGEISFNHAEINPAVEGRGLGSRMAAYILDDARVRGLRVRPRCPFVAAYIEGHPDYADLVAPEDRSRLGL